jgi:hypothetical protein
MRTASGLLVIQESLQSRLAVMVAPNIFATWSRFLISNMHSPSIMSTVYLSYGNFILSDFDSVPSIDV